MQWIAFVGLWIFTTGWIHAVPPSAKENIRKVRHAEESLYASILSEYDAYLASISDPSVHVEKCRFLGDLYWHDEYGYSKKQADFDECMDSLLTRYPDVPTVLALTVHFEMDELNLDSIDGILTDIEINPHRWKDSEKALMYKRYAELKSESGNEYMAIRYAEKAIETDTTLNLTLFLATQYEKTKDPESAIRVIEKSLENDSDPASYWMLAHKLMDLGADSLALDLFLKFEHHADSSDVYVDHAVIADAFIRNQRFAEARERLIMELGDGSDDIAILHKLLKFDFDHSPPDSMVATYQSLMKAGFTNDLFGIHRARLSLHAPFAAWSVQDAFKLGAWLLLILMICVIPYVWILPIDYLSKYVAVPQEFVGIVQWRFTLRDAWIWTSLLLFINIAASLITEYESVMMSLNDVYHYASDEIEALSYARLMVYTSIFSMVAMLFYVRRSDLELYLKSRWSIWETIVIVIGGLIVIFIATGLFSLILPLATTLNEIIIAINTQYSWVVGFVLVVLVAPIVEEYLFRGVLLSSITKKLGFHAATLIQAVLFAILHFNTSKLIFYLIFAVAAAWLVKKSDSLMPSTLMHMMNNLIAFSLVLDGK